MNYGELKEKLVEILGRDAFSAAFNLALATLNRDLRISEMVSTATITSASDALALPDRFLDVEALLDPSGCPVTPMAANNAGFSGQYILEPSRLRIIDGSAGDYSLTYFAALTALTDDASTNAALEHAEDAYFYTVLGHHANLIRDFESAQAWSSLAATLIGSANQRRVRQTHSGGRIRPGGTGSPV